MKIVAPNGSPLHAAVIGADSLERSTAFYRDIIGLQVIDEGELEGVAFAAFWHLPEGARARYAALAERDGKVGRILLIEFEGDDRQPIRTIEDESAFGHLNLNFYTADIHRDADAIAAAGYMLWSAPVRHQMTPEVGTPTEVMFDGPDTVIVNLVELSTTDLATRIGQMRDYVFNDFGLNAKGFTPVVTSMSMSPDHDADVRFYCETVGSGVLFSDLLGSPEQNLFSRFPENSHTRCSFLQGNHMFGKIVISQPVDYPCISLADVAVAPNIGYLAQAFLVPDVAAAVDRARAVGAADYSPPTMVYVPGLGEVMAAMVRAPASEALVLLVEGQA